MTRLFQAARKALLEVLEGMSQADPARSFPSHWAPESTPCGWACVCLAHDREHAQGLRDMRSESLRELDNVILVRAIGIPNDICP